MLAEGFEGERERERKWIEITMDNGDLVMACSVVPPEGGVPILPIHNGKPMLFQ